MKYLARLIGAMIGVSLLASQAMAAASGSFSLKPGETRQILIGATAGGRGLRNPCSMWYYDTTYMKLLPMELNFKNPNFEIGL